MKYFDPNRPTLGGDRAKLLETPYVLPGFYVTPVDEGLVDISVWLPTTAGAFSHHSLTIEPVQLPGLIASYLANPEQVLKEVFKWQPVINTTLSFEDLGL
jgi:hypothetical protein